jgi:hypothetical protein
MSKLPRFDALLDWCEETRDRRIFVREKDPPPVIEGGVTSSGLNQLQQ